MKKILIALMALYALGTVEAQAINVVIGGRVPTTALAAMPSHIHILPGTTFGVAKVKIAAVLGVSPSQIQKFIVDGKKVVNLGLLPDDAVVTVVLTK